MPVQKRFSRQVVSCAVSALLAFTLVFGCAGVRPGSFRPDIPEMENEFLKNLNPRDRRLAAFWHGGDGAHWAIVPRAEQNAVIIYDLGDGREIHRLGEKGSKKGQVDTPAEAVVADDLAFVLERGNHRVQVFTLPDLKSLGFIGENRLKTPSHLALYRIENGAYYLYVSDTRKGARGGTTFHILRFSASRAVNSIHGAYLQTFGYSPEEGCLGRVSALSVDSDKRCLLVREEGKPHPVTREYTLDGDFTGILSE